MKKIKRIINIKNIIIKNKRIKKMHFEFNNVSYTSVELEKKKLRLLYNFFRKFNKEERMYFGYPLFKPVSLSFNSFKEKYNYYLKEKKFWIYHLLFYKKKLIGFIYIKKIGFRNKKNTLSKSPTFGGPFILQKHRRKKLGYLLTKIIHYQASLLKLKKLYSKVVINNKGSLNLHLKTGFKRTNRKIKSDENIQEIEFVKNFYYPK